MPQGLVTGHRTNRLLAALQPEELAYLELNLDIVELPQGQVLYDTGETMGYAYFPHDTIVSLVTVLEDGDTVEMAVFGPEAMLGLASALVSRRALGRYIVHLPGRASRISVDHLHEAMATRPTIRRLALRFVEVLLEQTFQTVACNAAHPVEARCCRWILSTQDRLAQDTLPLTHELLSDLLGAQRSTVSMVLRRLQSARLISQGRGVITVMDRAGLKEVTCECYGKIRHSFQRLLPGVYPQTQ